MTIGTQGAFDIEHELSAPAPTASKPRLLDLYSAAGGASRGYHRAGFDVVGVDIAEQPDYPFEFHRGDAIEFLLAHGHEFDAIAASPPCQASCTLTKGTNRGREYPQLIPATRDALNRVGRPWVIENVQGAALRRDVVLCGEMFGLGVIRHRVFELGGWSAPQPKHVPHRGRVAGCRHGQWHDGPYFAVYGDGGGKGSVADWQRAMGIDWTTDRRSLAEAIPPAYTEWIGHQLRQVISPRVRPSMSMPHGRAKRHSTTRTDQRSH
ncbi:DNA cytosine methyltransferase [Nocardia canadensis]|uniref:DNA methylase n=1 Tax=Nocardia canadensis TaxID=3065238 RepID=UPI00292E3EFF|nr:DNA methylase [Nocardia canadensis]